ncbi:hypothetical protein ES288_A13G093800v1 [Gossypium darwinii]|uniref:Uncharacterized protein n=1 Tax=Gossypium darwinii TaxID=34276 RepID=A0A5D2DXU3_GOSDA|nr:hypothetical protein ES288_A13G093800v1 [Gossypium darwinii]
MKSQRQEEVDWCPTRTRRRHGRIHAGHTLKRVKKGHSRTLLWPESETEKKPIYNNRTLVNFNI